MQKFATRVFMYVSINFSLKSILVVLTGSNPEQPDSALSEFLIKLLFIHVFIFLPSYAKSFAGKYLFNI